MDHSKIEALESLLRECLQFVTIRSRTAGLMDVPAYRADLEKLRVTYDPELRRSISLFAPEVEQPQVKAAVLEVIRTELMDFFHEDKIYSAAGIVKRGIRNGATSDDILRTLLRRAIVDGEGAAAQAFSEWINSPSCVFRKYWAVAGLQVDSEVEVFDGIWLIPLSNSRNQLPPSLPDDMFSVFLRRPGEIDTGRPWVRTLLRIDYEISPNFLMLPRAYTDSIDVAIRSEEVPDFDLGSFFDALSLSCEHPFQLVGMWQEFLEHYEVFDLDRLMGPTSVQWSVRGDFHLGSTQLSGSGIEELKKLYADIMRLHQETRTALQVPITRWRRSMEQRDDTDSMIDLGIALESLYLKGLESELSFRFQLRAAWYLGKDQTDREALMEEFKQIYDYRSKAVHTGALPLNVSFGGKQIKMMEFIRQSQDLCLQSIKRVIHEGRLPNHAAWNTIVLGGDDG